MILYLISPSIAIGQRGFPFGWLVDVKVPAVVQPISCPISFMQTQIGLMLRWGGFLNIWEDLAACCFLFLECGGQIKGITNAFTEPTYQYRLSLKSWYTGDLQRQTGARSNCWSVGNMNTTHSLLSCLLCDVLRDTYMSIYVTISPPVVFTLRVYFSLVSRVQCNLHRQLFKPHKSPTVYMISIIMLVSLFHRWTICGSRDFPCSG